ncbi:dUTP diphosphatase [Luminiphilus sp. nBUS_16]|uniref:dUTP diphosphatase n=1 Tax=Luminiphilus sp. nBUS_16 TaxID=3395315 RepID=UPI003EB899D8|tara:strand:+ start:752 stop:1366 length:615 start_codon:yes stop_codon:yes gene_type:complete
MRQALETMLSMQHRMNTRVHEDWINQHFEWYRAIWIECGELMDHYGYKWWKKQDPDMAQVRLEVVDIWHFGLSALFSSDTDIAELAKQVAADLDVPTEGIQDVREATEALALASLQARGFSVPQFSVLMQACNLSFEDLYRHYVGKNVLNFFRQDHGYKEGSYQKLWEGREDNEHLAELMERLDTESDDFPSDVYSALKAKYPG